MRSMFNEKLGPAFDVTSIFNIAYEAFDGTSSEPPEELMKQVRTKHENELTGFASRNFRTYFIMGWIRAHWEIMHNTSSSERERILKKRRNRDCKCT